MLRGEKKMKIELEPEISEELEERIPEVLEGLSEEERASLVVKLFRNVFEAKREGFFYTAKYHF